MRARLAKPSLLMWHEPDDQTSAGCAFFCGFCLKELERLGESTRAVEMYRKALAMDRSIDFANEGMERLSGG